MRTPFKPRHKVYAALAILLLSVSSGFATEAPKGGAGRQPEPKEFDRLDGHGLSKVKVDVVEWEKNLELHVYPKGALHSLGLIMDRKSKTSKNPVMVIEYGFKGVPYTLIRRAMLTITMNDSFQVFRDDSVDDYDKIIISNNGMAGLKKFALAPAPTQLYPDHHALVAQGDVEAEKPPAALTPHEERTETPPPAGAKTTARPGQNARGVKLRPAEGPDSSEKKSRRPRNPSPSDADADGAIRSFAF